MARSSYIYVVQGPGGFVCSAFTVKHELASWVELERSGGRLMSDYEVTRVRDGSITGETTKLDINDL